MNKKEDRIESIGLEFQNKVRNGYIDIAKDEKRCVVIKCNNKSINKIHLEIIKTLKIKFKDMYV